MNEELCHYDRVILIIRDFTMSKRIFFNGKLMLKKREVKRFTIVTVESVIILLKKLLFTTGTNLNEKCS